MLGGCLTLSSGLGVAAAADLYSDVSLCRREGEGAGMMLGYSPSSPPPCVKASGLDCRQNSEIQVCQFHSFIIGDVISLPYF